ncbi:unnamed protein product [Dicrocoelium dendriticum]|nr:unnamed protein product [Dicrocoelium dendriticum]
MFRLLRLQRTTCSLTRNFNSQSIQRTKLPRTWKSYTLLVLPATCFALGYWQIGRRKWKLDLIAQLENNIHTAPLSLPSSAFKSSDLSEYCPVTVSGHFDHTREAFIGPRPLITDRIPPLEHNRQFFKPKSTERKIDPFYHYKAPTSTGYFVVTPFFLEDRPGISILVNRGWVPSSYLDPALRINGQITGTVKLTGLIRYQEKPMLFAPAPHPVPLMKGEKQRPLYQYCCRQIDAMANQLGTLPLLIDADYDSTIPGGPVGGQTRILVRNEHASYILTWYAYFAIHFIVTCLDRLIISIG